MKELTKKQRECLVAGLAGEINPFDHGSTTINVLRKGGLIARPPVAGSQYVLTDAGRAEALR